jgi:RecB family endonuclease NucS
LSYLNDFGTSVQTIRLWKIDDKKLLEVEKSKLNLEERLEDWIEDNVSIISSNLLVIGRQVKTRYGGLIDVLCIDEKGDIVIVELKRDKTPREITAQVLDYASWVKNLTAEQVQEIARDYLKDELDEAF